MLADIVYDAGKIAVGAGKGEAYSDALPVAYLHGGVTQAVADRSFSLAAFTVLESGATPEEGRVGTLAVLKTNATYLGITDEDVERAVEVIPRALGVHPVIRTAAPRAR